MELISTVHVAAQWRHGEVQNKKKKKEKEKEKGKGNGRRPLAVVREPRSTVLQREQWRHGAEEEGEGEGEGEEGEGEGLVISLLQGAPLLLCCNTVVTNAAPSCFGEGEGEREGLGKG
jgi:hypothetical protein